MKIVELQPKNCKKFPADKAEEMTKKLRKEYEKPVKGMFEFLDAQCGWFDFSYRWFKGDPIITLHLVHGEICELPMGIVKHINNTKRKIRSYDVSATNATVDPRLPPIKEMQSRIRFTPVDFM